MHLDSALNVNTRSCRVSCLFTVLDGYKVEADDKRRASEASKIRTGYFFSRVLRRDDTN